MSNLETCILPPALNESMNVFSSLFQLPYIKKFRKNCTSEFTHVEVSVCTTLYLLIFWEPLQLFPYFIKKN